MTSIKIQAVVEKTKNDKWLKLTPPQGSAIGQVNVRADELPVAIGRKVTITLS